MTVLERMRAEGEAGFPRHALRGSRTALCLFAAAFGGKQDAAWLEEAGLRTTCVDTDEARLREMRDVYPDAWEFVHGDALEVISRYAEEGMRFDVVTADPFTGTTMEATAEAIRELCAVARELVIVGVDRWTTIDAPAGWQIVDTRKRSTFKGGTFWVVLQPTGAGVDPADVTACLVTRGDQPDAIEEIISELPYGEVIVWDNSVRNDWLTAGRFGAMMQAANRVVYFQDDDTRFRFHDELCAAYNPGGITAVYGHGETPAGYDDLPLVCGGALADRVAILDALCEWRNGISLEIVPRESPQMGLLWTREELAYADFIVGVLTPFRHVHLPFEIVLEVAQHPSRLCNQPWAAAAKADVTARARAIRDRR